MYIWSYTHITTSPQHQLVERVDQIDTPSERAIKLFRDFWLYCIIMGFSDFEIGMNV